MEKGINFLNRDFEDYRSGLRDFTNRYYPNLSDQIEDASIGSFLIDLVASVSDNLSFHIDRSLNETQIDSAFEKNSLFNIARTNGFKVPGPKGAITEVVFSCELPLTSNLSNSPSSVPNPNWAFAPIIKKGTQVTSGKQSFEIQHDINFGEQFNEEGHSNRNIIPKRNANGIIERYTITKTDTVVAGISDIFSQVINSNDIKPFMEILLPVADIMNIESIILKDGNDFNIRPTINEFMMESEFISANDNAYKTNTYRFFEVNSLLEQYRWGDVIDELDFKPKVYKYGFDVENRIIPVYSICKGEWKPIRQKFITEFTDNGYLKVIFGPGSQIGRENINIDNASDFTKYQITSMISNDSMGVLPQGGQTMHILYRRGGGQSSNIPVGAINRISALNVEIGCIGQAADNTIIDAVRKSLKVTNTIPSISGKNMPTEDEIKFMIKYNSGAQERCVTVKDYESRILQLPPRYGTPFRVGCIEENNKIMVYMLNIDHNGYLTDLLPGVLVSNIENYLSEYRMTNDFVEMKSGRIINLSFEADLYINKNFNKADVVSQVINTISEYMDIQKHKMGQNIYVSDLRMEISKVDGVINLIDLRVFNEFGPEYSQTQSSQIRKTPDLCVFNSNQGGAGEGLIGLENKFEIDLEASDEILFSESDIMMEVKYRTRDIRIRVKSR